MERERLPWFLDETTGFPLPLVPYKDAPNVYNRDGSLYHSDPDYHHSFFPRRSFLAETAGSSSTLVRISRSQKVRRFYHMRAHEYLSAPEVSINPETSFYLATLALSNYVPSTAIDLKAPQPIRRELSVSEYAELRESVFKGYKGGTEENLDAAVGSFLLRTMLINNPDVVEHELKCELLEAAHAKRRNDVANRIANLITYHAVAPINDLIRECRKTGEIPESQPSPFKLITDLTKSTDRPAILTEALRHAA